jgi:hypothetical protein
MAKKIEKKAIRMPDVLIQLGRAVSVECEDGNKISWTAKSGCLLYSAVSGRTLYCLVSKKKVTSKEEFDAAVYVKMDKVRRGMDLYSKWSEFESESGSLAQRPKGTLTCLGRAKSIVYSSDKWVLRARSYIHTFINMPKVWANKKTNPTLVVLTGGKIQVKKEGITG